MKGKKMGEIYVTYGSQMNTCSAGKPEEQTLLKDILRIILKFI
jgi:hypothetical protein